MQENIVAILAEMHSRLSQLLPGAEFYPPPARLQLRHPKAVFLGLASEEQQAIAVLYDQVCTEHEQMHTAEGLPMGIHPRVSFGHFQNHVMAPMLSELLIWSAHRAYPEVSETMSIVAVQIDADWNMYAIPKEVVAS